MRTSETLLLDFIKQTSQFRIPVNQRRYAWTRRHCRQLWEDALDAGVRQDVREHFLGPVIQIAAVDPLNAHWAPCLVYDGQQRLTTITLILKALSRHLEDDTAPDGFEPDQIRSEYLARSRRVEDAGPEALSADLRSCANHYRAMVLGEEPDAALAQAFGELARLDTKPVWPFLIHLYGDYAGKRLSRHDLLALTRLVTAYVVRRAVCGDRPAAPPPVFARAAHAIDPERYVESVRALFLCLSDGFAFPSDEAFRAELASRNMYRFKHRDALLERLENNGRKECVPLSSYTNGTNY